MIPIWKLGRSALALACSAAAADLPVQHVVIYKNGVALFERSGTVPAGEQARLEFRTADMNDILKSLTIVDSTGHRVNSVRYDSNETLERRLQDFPFAVGRGELLSQFLDRFKGAAVDLKTSDRTLSGTILGARAIQSGADEKAAVHREQITLLVGSGELVTLDLGAVSSLQFPEVRLQNQLKQYLQTLNDSRSQEKRSVYVDSTGTGPQDLKMAYVIPAAIWKSSYRLTLNQSQSTIEGWAIVDNTTDEDWNRVQLSVVSGRPVSFISQLDTPRYGKRAVAELPDDAAAGPVVYGGSVGGVLGGIADEQADRASAGLITEPMMTRNAPLPSPDVFRQATQAPRTTNKISESSVQGANSGMLGELFEYSFAQPITIKRNQSAMIPFVQDRIAARKLLIFDNSGGEHPVNAAELTNGTGKTLDGGPLTVYEQGAYAGEALVETVKAGDKRLVGYAVDYGTRITTAFDTENQTIREIHSSEGMLRLRYASRQTRTYTINNVDPKPKILVVQQEGISQYSVLSPKPSDRTATAYRFEVALEANKSRTFKVEQERVYDDITEVTSATPDHLLTLVENKQISDAGRKQLQALVDVKRRLAETTDNLQATQSQMKELTADQTRTRENIDSLNRVSGQEQQVRQYSAQLGANEVQQAKLRDTQKTLAQQKTTLEAAVRKAIGDLNF